MHPDKETDAETGRRLAQVWSSLPRVRFGKWKSGRMAGALALVRLLGGVGLTLAHAAGERSGYSRGDSVGFDRGKHEGYTLGETDGFQDGRTEGYAEGREVGFSDGRESGYAEGVRDGRTDGYAQGYSQGSRTAYSRGWENGCRAVFTALGDDTAASWSDVDGLGYDPTYVSTVDAFSC